MSTLNSERGLRTSSPLSKPRAVYSIDQILGNHHRRNTINGKLKKESGICTITHRRALKSAGCFSKKYSNDQISMKTFHANNKLLYFITVSRSS